MRIIFAIIGLIVFAASSVAAQSVCDPQGRDGACEVQDGYYRIVKPGGGGPYPTVVYLYGSTGNSRDLIERTTIVREFVKRGYAVVVPIALDVTYASGADSGWFLRHERGRKERDEIAYLQQVIDHAAQRHGVDRKRLLFAGQSRGGFLIWEIACHRPNLARAYAPHAAGYLGPMPDRCAGPVRLLHSHGTRDTVVPLDPDKAVVSGGARMVPLEQSLKVMARTSGCEIKPVTDTVLEYKRQRWRGCPPGAGIEYLEHNGGHSYPMSWVSQVLNWFERDRRVPVATSTGGGTPVFKGSGGSATPGFKGVGQQGSGTGGRFKRVPQ